MSRYAVVKNNIVENIIIADEELASRMRGAYDYVVNIEGLSVKPQIKYTYDGESFSPPSVVSDPVAETEAIIKNAREFGDKLITIFAAENIRLGIMQAGKTTEVRQKLSSVMQCLQTGSLYDAISQLRLIPEEDKDLVFITDARLLIFLNEIENYLGLSLSNSL